MSAIAGNLVGGLFALACHVQDVDPTLGSPVGEAHDLSFVSRDGKGSMIGWAELDGQGNMVARRGDDGVVRVTGATFKRDGTQTWAQLLPNGGDFEMEWLIYDHLAKDGRATVAVWSKGRCEQLGTEKGELK